MAAAGPPSRHRVALWRVPRARRDRTLPDRDRAGQGRPAARAADARAGHERAPDPGRVLAHGAAERARACSLAGRAAAGAETATPRRTASVSRPTRTHR